MTREEELQKLEDLLDVVDLPWEDDETGKASSAVGEHYAYTILEDVEDKGKFRVYYGKGRYKQVGTVAEGKEWATDDHLKGKLLKLLKFKDK